MTSSMLPMASSITFLKLRQTHSCLHRWLGLQHEKISPDGMRVYDGSKPHQARESVSGKKPHGLRIAGLAGCLFQKFAFSWLILASKRCPKSAKRRFRLFPVSVQAVLNQAGQILEHQTLARQTSPRSGATAVFPEISAGPILEPEHWRDREGAILGQQLYF